MWCGGAPHNGDPDMIEENNASKPEVARVSVRLPTFWAKQPASWFAQAEAHILIILHVDLALYFITAQDLQ
jgi:hypothetical protein